MCSSHTDVHVHTCVHVVNSPVFQVLIHVYDCVHGTAIQLQKDNSQGSIDLFECVGVDKTTGRKGFGFDIKVCICNRQCNLHVRISKNCKG